MVSKQVLSTRDQIHWVKFPKLYTRKEIPVDPSEVATPLKLKKWCQPDCIAGKIASDDAVSIVVLIGANCAKALGPIDFIAHENGGPYTFSKLGTFRNFFLIEIEITYFQIKSQRVCNQNISIYNT